MLHSYHKIKVFTHLERVCIFVHSNTQLLLLGSWHYNCGYQASCERSLKWTARYQCTGHHLTTCWRSSVDHTCCSTRRLKPVQIPTYGKTRVQLVGSTRCRISLPTSRYDVFPLGPANILSSQRYGQQEIESLLLLGWWVIVVMMLKIKCK